MADTAVPSVQCDNDRTRVTEWRFAPGATTGWHRHEYDYVIVPITSGLLGLTGPDGTVTQAELQAGVSYFREAGVEHDVQNINDFEFSCVEGEFKK